MEEVLFHKFTQHQNIRTMLLKTGNAKIVYSDPQDPYWGSGAPFGSGGDYPGTNYLGALLEKVRDRLRMQGYSVWMDDPNKIWPPAPMIFHCSCMLMAWRQRYDYFLLMNDTSMYVLFVCFRVSVGFMCLTRFFFLFVWTSRFCSRTCLFLPSCHAFRFDPQL